MAQIDIYLKRLVSQNELSYQEDFLGLYTSIPNEDLQTLFAVYHTQLNIWFTTLNSDLRIEYDEDGNRLYKGGYFHAQDSRYLLSVMEAIDQLHTKCRGTEYAFKICDRYADAIRRCWRFVVKSGGSTIPEGFSAIEIVDLSPIFQLENGVAILQDRISVCKAAKAKKTLSLLMLLQVNHHSAIFSYYLFYIVQQKIQTG